MNTKSVITFVRFAVRPSPEDEYIQTYKVGKRKEELDKLASKGRKRFSLIGV